MSAIDAYLENNARYSATFDKDGLRGAPAKEISIVACMDARLDPAAVLGLEDGDAHVIRNAGGIVTEDVLRSLIISQRLLGTREIMLIHHTGCGMLGFTDAELSDSIEKDTGARPTFAMGAFTNLEDSVRESIEKIRACRFLSHSENTRGFVYDVGTGLLREVESG